MKIAIASSRFPSVTQTFVLREITSLIDLGHDVDIYAFGRDHGPVHEPVEDYGLLKRTHYLKPVGGRRKCMHRLAWDLTRAALRRPAATAAVCGTRRFPDQRRDAAIWCAAPLLARGHYDVIHAHFGGVAERLAALTPLLKPGVLTAHLHAQDIVRQDAAGPRRYPLLMQQGAVIVSESAFMVDVLRDQGFRPDRLHVHRLPVVIPDTKAKVKATNSETLDLLSVGRLVQKKGFATLLDAAARLRNQGSRFTLSIIGDGPLRQSLERQINDAGLNPCVRLLGAQPQSVVHQAMQDADIFVLASATAPDGDQEGTPTVLLEAQAHGLPIVSTHHSGIPEIVPDGRVGILCPEHDAAALAVALAKLADHPSMRREMGEAGRQHVAQDFNAHRLSKELLEYWSTSLKKHAALPDRS